MKADKSFSQKIKAGWTRELLMTYYALTEAQYEKIVECLKGIWHGVRI
jgi:Cys-tRNA synthase (O-phospho-L-seryl-tRNA:Cys-tRNA synthase)